MDLFETLRAAADPEKAARMSAYMRGQFPFLGIQTPDRRKLARSFIKSLDRRNADWDFVFECWRQPEREFQYAAQDYLSGLAGVMVPEDVPNLRELAVTKSWWDTVDGIDVIAGSIALRFPEVSGVLLEWSLDENFWLRRLAIDHQRGRREKTDTSLLERIIANNLGQSEFFVNKAIGWALRDYSKTDPDWVRGFLERHGHGMSGLSVREAGKYV